MSWNQCTTCSANLLSSLHLALFLSQIISILWKSCLPFICPFCQSKSQAKDPLTINIVKFEEPMLLYYLRLENEVRGSHILLLYSHFFLLIYHYPRERLNILSVYLKWHRLKLEECAYTQRIICRDADIIQ